MSELRPRRAAVIGLVAALAGLVANVLLVLAGGSGLTGYYLGAFWGSYLFYGCVALVVVGLALAGVARRSSGIAVALVAALCQMGWLIGNQIALQLLVIPHG